MDEMNNTLPIIVHKICMWKEHWDILAKNKADRERRKQSRLRCTLHVPKEDMHQEGFGERVVDTFYVSFSTGRH
jgi:hypothetical protein